MYNQFVADCINLDFEYNKSPNFALILKVCLGGFQYVIPTRFLFKFILFFGFSICIFLYLYLSIHLPLIHCGGRGGSSPAPSWFLYKI